MMNKKKGKKSRMNEQELNQQELEAAQNAEIPAEETAAVSFPAAGRAESVDLSGFFNCEFTKIHEQSFMSPRPAGYSIGMQKNGRYAWEWNHFGHNGFRADDSALRSCGGVWQLPDGSSFRTPEAGCNTVGESQQTSTIISNI